MVKVDGGFVQEQPVIIRIGDWELVRPMLVLACNQMVNETQVRDVG